MTAGDYREQGPLSRVELIEALRTWRFSISQQSRDRSAQKRHTLSQSIVTEILRLPFLTVMFFWNCYFTRLFCFSSIAPADNILICGVHGDPFGVKIEKDETVSDLKEYTRTCQLRC